MTAKAPVNPRLAVVIPVYGNWEDTLECLETLKSQTTRDFQVIIADDGSPSAPPPRVEAGEFGRYLRGEHLGYGGNCNRAAHEAIASGATHLLFLNSDAAFGERFMEHLTDRVSEMPQAILSPLVHWSRYPQRIWSSGGRLTLLTPFVRSRQRFQQTTEVDIITGCAILVPRHAWIALGGFDPTYTMYFEDFDLTLRAKAQGVHTCVVPDPELTVFHAVSGSFRSTGAWSKHYLMLTSSLIFIRRHYRGLKKGACLSLAFAHLCVTALRSLPELPRLALLRNAILQGFK